MSLIIKTLENEYIYDADFSLQTDSGITTLKANKMYQVLTQMGPQGQVGYGFLRMDNGLIPFKDDIVINLRNVIISGKLDESSNFGKMFLESRNKESARKSGIVL
jgi:hypothetical protein